MAQESKHDPFAAARQPTFQLYSLNQVLAALANSLLTAVIAWQVYAISGSAIDLGFLALARFVSALATSLIGGVVADSFDRRIVMACSTVVPFICALVLGIATLGGWVRLELIFALVMMTGFASSFEGPARQALLPAIVKKETFANAVAVSNVIQRLGSITGPSLAGFLIATVSISTTYFIFCGTLLSSIIPLLLLHYERFQGGGRRANLQSALEGLRFVRSQQPILGAMTLDMFAVIFGGAAALLPIYATDILKVGPSGFGFLTSSMQVGAMLASLFLVFHAPVRRTGRLLVFCVIIYGLVTVAFGISREFYLSLFLYGVLGAFNQVSVVMRQQIIQMATPDELRGRVSAVYQVFLGASNQGGAMESGFVAAATSATFAVVSGGFGASVVAGFIGWRMPKLYRYESVSGEVPADAAPAAEPVVPAATSKSAT